MSIKKFIDEMFLIRLNNLINEQMKGSWAELARKSNISQSTLSNYKKGTEPSLESAIKIANALNVTTDWLITGKGEQPISESARKVDQLMDYLTDEQKQDILRQMKEKKELNELKKSRQKESDKKQNYA